MVKHYYNFNIQKKHKGSIVLIGNFDGLHKGHQKLFPIRISKATLIFNSFDKNQDGRIYTRNIEAVLQYMVKYTFRSISDTVLIGQFIADFQG